MKFYTVLFLNIFLVHGLSDLSKSGNHSKTNNNIASKTEERLKTIELEKYQNLNKRSPASSSKAIKQKTQLFYSSLCSRDVISGHYEKLRPKFDAGLKKLVKENKPEDNAIFMDVKANLLKNACFRLWCSGCKEISSVERLAKEAFEQGKKLDCKETVTTFEENSCCKCDLKFTYDKCGTVKPSLSRFKENCVY